MKINSLAIFVFKINELIFKIIQGILFPELHNSWRWPINLCHTGQTGYFEFIY